MINAFVEYLKMRISSRKPFNKKSLNIALFYVAYGLVLAFVNLSNLNELTGTIIILGALSIVLLSTPFLYWYKNEYKEK